MRMIDVLNMMAKGEIKAQTDLLIYDYIECIDIYTFDGKAFYDGCDKEIGTNYNIDGEFLNYTVELVEPKKYQLKLYKDDDLSYVTRSSYDADFNYDLSSRSKFGEFITKFTQEEIDNDKFLKFIEQHGIKEEVEYNENDWYAQSYGRGGN